ncbi:hypothetical protein [Streptomyces johnsoniae]|uniref:Uncharacterized protein n=1 Tax=Streptomyces johnsoniae TaxID=3075532 RepID=A0ABU2S783_9ACTN|nr:hypothetical protein [Streptomyces sp. DSM 41886]MDT0444274.1 hypothetical protein [Streptomyces sp. DSM 41886]
MTHTSRANPWRWRLLVAASLFALVTAPLSASGPVAAAESTAGGEAESTDPLVALSEHVSPHSAADFTAGSWAPFASARDAAVQLIERGEATAAERTEARAALQEATDDLVMVRGLTTLVADYETASPPTTPLPPGLPSPKR